VAYANITKTKGSKAALRTAPPVSFFLFGSLEMSCALLELKFQETAEESVPYSAHLAGFKKFSK